MSTGQLVNGLGQPVDEIAWELIGRREIEKADALIEAALETWPADGSLLHISARSSPCFAVSIRKPG